MTVDVIVIGGGLDGLAAAALAARSGRKVTLLAHRASVGGLSAGAEFHPGYRHTGVLPYSGAMQDWVTRALGVADLPRRPSPPVALPGGVHLEPLPPGLGGFVDRVRPVAGALLHSVPPDISQDAPLWPLIKQALGLRKLGNADLMELLRVAPLCVDDWLEEGIADPVQRAAHAWPALLGTWTGPRSPLSTLALLLHQFRSGDPVVGGPAAVVKAVAGAAEAAGVEIRTGAQVTAIRVAGGAVEGVTLADGETLDARQVLSTIGPRHTLMALIDPWSLPPEVEEKAAVIRSRGATAVVHLALSGPLMVDGHPDAPERLRVVTHPNDLERAFDDVKHRRLPTRPPPLDVWVPSVSTPGLAPEGHHVATIVVHGVPYVLDAGWSDQARGAVRTAVLERLSAVAPGLEEHLVADQTLTPWDLEAQFGMAGGHVFHAELALDQLGPFRPAHGLSRHGVPGISGLFLGGAACHPGGWTGGGGGVLAAKAMLGLDG